jgi:hypothetical protein
MSTLGPFAGHPTEVGTYANPAADESSCPDVRVEYRTSYTVTRILPSNAP